MKPRSRYIAHSSSLTHERSSSRARCSARRSRPGSPRSCSSVCRRRGRALRCARRFSAHRSTTGAASAAATIARTSRASSTARSAACPAGEEDPPLGLGRDLVVCLDHPRLATPVVGSGLRARRPHALVELAAELLDEPLLVLAHGRIALGQEDLSMSRLHTEELQSLLPGE